MGCKGPVFRVISGNSRWKLGTDSCRFIKVKRLLCVRPSVEGLLFCVLPKVKPRTFSGRNIGMFVVRGDPALEIVRSLFE